MDKNKPVTRIEYHESTVAPDQTGWYINEYMTIDDLMANIPCEVVGPYATQAAAQRMLRKENEVRDGRRRYKDMSEVSDKEADDSIQ